MENKTNATLKKAQIVFLEVLEKNAGLIHQSCKKANIAVSTFYNWKEENQLFSEKVDDINESLIDFVEGKLLENIKSNESAAIFFYLKCKGKKRGYIEKQEVEHSGKVDTIINVIPFQDK